MSLPPKGSGNIHKSTRVTIMLKQVCLVHAQVSPTRAPEVVGITCLVFVEQVFEL